MNEDALARLRRDAIGIIFQAFYLIPTMTALENVSVPLELAGRADAADRAAESLRAVGLAHRLTHLPGQLSGGEQQRVALARAFAPEPALLLADEPTGNLDHATGAAVMDLLFALRERTGTTLLLITHDHGPGRRAASGGCISWTGGSPSRCSPDAGAAAGAAGAAGRDAGLRIVLACLALGVAVIAGVGSLRVAIERGLDADGSRILGGDLEVEGGSQPLPDSLRDWLRARGARLSDVVVMRSMLVAQSGERQLIELKAVDDAWPLVGTADPPAARARRA